MTDREALQPRIAWGITGAGHFLPDCVEILCDSNMIDIFLSKAAKEVLSDYRLFEKLKNTKHLLYSDEDASSHPMTRLYKGKYDLVVIAPVTASSIAKMVNGIADNLITNLFAHAGKCQIPTILLPCDVAADLKSVVPGGDEVSVHVREIDRENIKRLAEWPGVSVMSNPKQLKNQIEQYFCQK